MCVELNHSELYRTSFFSCYCFLQEEKAKKEEEKQETEERPERRREKERRKGKLKRGNKKRKMETKAYLICL